MLKDTLISAVIATVQRDKKYLKSCLVSLEKSADYANISLEIVIIANGTRLDKPAYIKSPCKIITNKENVGFGRAINQGMKIAKGEWCIILAPDTRCQHTALKLLMKHINIPKLAIVGPKIYFPDGSLDFTMLPFTSLWTIFLEQSYLYKLFPKIFHHPFGDKSLYETTREVNALASTFWLIKKEYFRKIGGFDPRFFLFHEDTDLCKRMIDNGFIIFYDCHALVKHLGHKSAGETISAELHIKSYFIYLSKYHNKLYENICLFILIIGTVIRLIFFGFNNPENKYKKKYLTTSKIRYLKGVISEGIKYINNRN